MDLTAAIDGIEIENTPVPAPVSLPDTARIIKALWELNPSRADDRESWRNVGFALHSAGDYFAAFDEWSKQSSKYGETREFWDSIKPKTGGISVNSLFFWAREDKQARKPLITIGVDLQSNIDEAIESLRDAENVYQSVGTLSQIAFDPEPAPLATFDNGAPRAAPIPRPTLTAILSSNANYQRWNAKSKKHVPCLPPDNIVSGVHAAVHFPGVKPLYGIVSHPLLLPDGTIVASPGYHAPTGRFLDIKGDYPSLMSSDEAISRLLDVVSDFPFQDDAHRSGWIAAVCTFACRSAFKGCSPFFLFEANTSRAGKGLATNIISMILQGRRASRYSAPVSEEEWNKVITSIAMSGVPMVLIDNIKGKFGSASLENALTADRFAARILGTNTTVEITVCWGWAGTGNNLTVTFDMVGRIVGVRLESPLERPGERTDFKHANLIEHVKVNRRELVIAALSIPAQFILAGRPHQHLTAWGGFEGWSDLIRQSLVHAGLPDCDTRQHFAATADEDSELLARVMDGWEGLGQMRVADVIALVNEPQHEGLRLALEEVCRGKIDALKIGTFLRDQKGRVIGNKRFCKSDGKSPRWFLQES